LPGRTPYEAWDNSIDPMRKALQCVTLERLALLERTPSMQTDVIYPVALHDMNSVRLKSRIGVYLVAGQNIRIYEADPRHAQERYRVMTLKYTYGFTHMTTAGKEVELLTFHWSREHSPGDRSPPGHLHIGNGLLADPTVIRAGDFANAHIPTERLSLEAVIRFAIMELEVEPLRDDWADVLDETEGVFKARRTM
jgi:hypothetical protein